MTSLGSGGLEQGGLEQGGLEQGGLEQVTGQRGWGVRLREQQWRAFPAWRRSSRPSAAGLWRSSSRPPALSSPGPVPLAVSAPLPL